MLQGTGAVLASAAFSTRVMAAAPPPERVTPALIDAAKKEGKVIYYTSTDLPVAEKLAKAFEAKYPGIAVRVERTGAERVFQRIGQEYASNIHAVDVVNSSDAAHFIVWKRDGILAPYVPEDVAKFYPTEHKDVDGQFASWRASYHRTMTQIATPESVLANFDDIQVTHRLDAVISRADIESALDPNTGPSDKKLQYIQECFDSLFYYMATLEHYIASTLILPADVAFPLDYYVPLLAS
jgi:hypothetical protein